MKHRTFFWFFGAHGLAMPCVVARAADPVRCRAVNAYAARGRFLLKAKLAKFKCTEERTIETGGTAAGGAEGAWIEVGLDIYLNLRP